LAGYWRVVSPHADDPTPDPGEDIAENRPNGRPIQMRTAYLFMAAVTVMLMGCASSPSPDDTRRLTEGNRWELVRWGDRTVPHGDNGEPRRMEFEGAFIRAFETSTGYRVEGERLVFESGVASPMEFYRRPLER
jgi:hypothetical protein